MQWLQVTSAQLRKCDWFWKNVIDDTVKVNKTPYILHIRYVFVGRLASHILFHYMRHSQELVIMRIAISWFFFSPWSSSLPLNSFELASKDRFEAAEGIDIALNAAIIPFSRRNVKEKTLPFKLPEGLQFIMRREKWLRGSSQEQNMDREKENRNIQPKRRKISSLDMLSETRISRRKKNSTNATRTPLFCPAGLLYSD